MILLVLGLGAFVSVFLTACPRAEKTSGTASSANSANEMPMVQAQVYGEEESEANKPSENES